MSNPIKTLIANEADLLNSTNFITGFELEFHACNGQKYRGEDNYENDYEAAIAHLNERRASGSANLGMLLGSAGEDFKTAHPFASEVIKTNRSLSLSSFAQTIDKLRTEEKEEVKACVAKIDEAIAVLKAAYASYVFTIEDCNNDLDMDDFQKRCEQNSIVKTSKEYASAIELKTDGTVRGGELVLDTPLPIAEALKVASDVFAKNTFEIDEGCSFHIHLSAPGVTHSYSQGLQWELMLYVLSQFDRAPASLKKRWKKNLQYFKPQLSTEKYSFVHFHGQYRTWEFRCFGNVNSIEEAYVCYELALEAMQHAYRVQLGLTPSLASGIFNCGNQRGIIENLHSQLGKGKFNLDEVKQLIASSEAA